MTGFHPAKPHNPFPEVLEYWSTGVLEYWSDGTEEGRL